MWSVNERQSIDGGVRLQGLTLAHMKAMEEVRLSVPLLRYVDFCFELGQNPLEQDARYVLGKLSLEQHSKTHEQPIVAAFLLGFSQILLESLENDERRRHFSGFPKSIRARRPPRRTRGPVPSSAEGRSFAAFFKICSACATSGRC